MNVQKCQGQSMAFGVNTKTVTSLAKEMETLTSKGCFCATNKKTGLVDVWDETGKCILHLASNEKPEKLVSGVPIYA